MTLRRSRRAYQRGSRRRFVRALVRRLQIALMMIHLPVGLDLHPDNFHV
jgi:hypothetical protein